MNLNKNHLRYKRRIQKKIRVFETFTEVLRSRGNHQFCCLLTVVGIALGTSVGTVVGTAVGLAAGNADRRKCLVLVGVAAVIAAAGYRC